MGSERLFRDHPDPPRKRRKRLISYLHPILRRAVKAEIKRFPPALKQQFQDAADQAGVSAASVFMYALIAYQAKASREERLQALRSTGLYEGATDDQLETAFAEMLEQLNAEMKANRKRK